jgi:hypothetical protein
MDKHCRVYFICYLLILIFLVSPRKGSKFRTCFVSLACNSTFVSPVCIFLIATQQVLLGSEHELIYPMDCVKHNTYVYVYVTALPYVFVVSKA